MSEIADRWRTIAGAFGRVVDGVDDWDAPTPCEGWVAHDVVDHLCEWIGAYFFSTWDLGPTPTTWAELNAGIQAALNDPEVATAERDTRFGPATFESQIAMIAMNDVLIHTWDLARATGQDESIDPAEVSAMLAGIEPMIDDLVASGHYAPPVPAPDGASDQVRLLALLGRRA